MSPLTGLQLRCLIRNDEERLNEINRQLDDTEGMTIALFVRLREAEIACKASLARNRARLAGQTILSEIKLSLPPAASDTLAGSAVTSAQPAGASQS